MKIEKAAAQIYSITGAILDALPCWYQNGSGWLKAPLMRFLGGNK